MGDDLLVADAVPHVAGRRRVADPRPRPSFVFVIMALVYT
jgi:hypothetical protein